MLLFSVFAWARNLFFFYLVYGVVSYYDYFDISSSPSIGEDLIEPDNNYRTDEVPVA
jgi:hypothetical protein